MKIAFCFALAAIIVLASCSKKSPEVVKNDSIENKDTIRKTDTPLPANTIFGYRFIISGDFNGDGKKENLIEHYYSRTLKKESFKFYENVEDDSDVWDRVMKKRPYSFVLSDDKSIDTLRISNELQLFGISYLKNEGDLNGDGTDEVSYVTDFADMSSLNTWHIMTYARNHWKELYSFPIWDWQLPVLPESVSKYGLFGLEKRYVVQQNDTLNIRIEKELKAFKGLVTKIEKNKIQVIFRNEEADEDTLIVNLKKLKSNSK